MSYEIGLKMDTFKISYLLDSPLKINFKKEGMGHKK